jgi:3-hydroxyacyl-CoA dehydrogenase
MYYKSFLTIAMAKVSTSAYEAFDTGLLQHGKDIVVNKDRQIAEAKTCFINGRSRLYQPIRRTDVKVLGKQARNVLSRNRPNGSW